MSKEETHQQQKAQDQEKQPHQQSARNLTLIGAIFNLTKSAVGVGTLFLFGKLQDLGFAWGLQAIFLAAAFSTLSLHFLSRMAHNCDTGDYFVLGRMAMGPFGERLTSIALLLFLYGALVCYCMFVGSYVGKTLEALIVDFKYENYKALVTILPTMLFMFPIACLRDMSALAVTSIIGMVSMLGVTGLVVYTYFTTSEPILTLKQAFATKSVYGPEGWHAFGGIIFAFVNHFTVVGMMPSLQNPTPARRAALNIGSTLAALGIYLPCAVFGYLMFSTSGYATILDLPGNKAFTCARAVVALIVSVSFPLLLDPARSTLASLLPFPDSATRHYGLTALLTVAPLLTLLLFGKSCDALFNLLAAMCGSLLVFILPGVFMLRLRSKMTVHSWEVVGAYLLVGFGLITLFTGTLSCAASFFK